MPMYVLNNRSYTLRSLQGRIVNFKRGEPAFVPPQCVQEAIEIGAEPVEGEAPAVGPDEDIKLPPAPTGDERDAKIIAAFKALKLRNEREDFNGAGYPAARAVTAVVGFSVPTKEVNRLWAIYREREAA